MRISIIYARSWDFADKQDPNRRVKGCEVMYVPPQTDKGYDDEKGSKPVTVKADISVFASLRQVPGMYDVEIELQADREGRAVGRLVSCVPAAGVNGAAAASAPAGVR